MDTITLKIMYTALIIFAATFIIIKNTKPDDYPHWVATSLIRIALITGTITVMSLIKLVWS